MTAALVGLIAAAVSAALFGAIGLGAGYLAGIREAKGLEAKLRKAKDRNALLQRRYERLASVASIDAIDMAMWADEMEDAA